MTSKALKAINKILSGDIEEGKSIINKYYTSIFLDHIKSEYLINEDRKKSFILLTAINVFVKIPKNELLNINKEHLFIAKMSVIIKNTYNRFCNNGVLLEVFDRLKEIVPLSEKLIKNELLSLPSGKELFFSTVNKSLYKRKYSKYKTLIDNSSYIFKAWESLENVTGRMDMSRCKVFILLKLVIGLDSKSIENALRDFYDISPESFNTKLSSCLDKLYDHAMNLYINDQNERNDN